MLGHSAVNQEIFDALTALQHRGQDAAGMMTLDQGRVVLRKGNGLVRDVFRTRHMLRLTGQVGIGHVRYPTAGTSSLSEAQPFYVNSPYGIALAHNGNLVNPDQLKEEVFRSDRRHINTYSDSEILLNVFAHELGAAGGIELTPDAIFEAVRRVHERCQGAYAVVAMIVGGGLVAFRDPNGIRPLVYGTREHAKGPEYFIASENVALDMLGFKAIGDVAPGEAIFIDLKGTLHRSALSPQNTRRNPCIFEYVYFARPDSTIDQINVYKMRLHMGETLADKILKVFPEHDIDVVIPIPDTSRTAALSLASRLSVKFREGFVKNRYIGRTFIMPGQALRKRSVQHKLNTIGLEFRNKNVLLVDDSIVRGTTSRQIIQMARDAGAKKVYFASAAPPIRYPNVYGIDMPARSELIAYGRTVEEVCREIGADWLVYQDLPDLIRTAQAGNPDIEQFECSIFDGHYLTPGVDEAYLNFIEQKRGEAEH